jgi:S1-C subfamily serine protease
VKFTPEGGKVCVTMQPHHSDDAVDADTDIMEIKIAEPLRGYDLTRANFNRRRNPQMCEWAIAVGLGLKGMDQTITAKEEEITAV